jgi:hypothetical protein
MFDVLLVAVRLADTVSHMFNWYFVYTTDVTIVNSILGVHYTHTPTPYHSAFFTFAGITGTPARDSVDDILTSE